jgi:hypothetical protein
MTALIATTTNLTVLATALFFVIVQTCMAQKSQLSIPHANVDFSVGAFQNSAWKTAGRVDIDRNWSGSAAAAGRKMRVQLLWSETALYVRFEAVRNEPLVVNDKPQLAKKTMQLWDRDVGEIFLAPDKNEPRRYFEFEVAPTGEWIDLAIDLTSGKRVTDWEYRSGMEAAAKIEKNRIVMAMKIPWTAFGKKPKPGDVWLGNIFRAVGADPNRGYLAWQPTMTATPNFHVPEKFGMFNFVR